VWRNYRKDFESCVFCAPIDRYIGQHIDWHIGWVSVDISTDARPICWSTCQPPYRSICVGWHINRDISRYLDRHSAHNYFGRYVNRELLLSDSWPTYQAIGYRHSANTSLLLAYWPDCNLSRRHDLTLVSDFCWAAQISLIYPPLLRGFFVYSGVVNHTKLSQKWIETQSSPQLTSPQPQFFSPRPWKRMKCV